MIETFKAFQVNKQDDNFSAEVTSLTINDLPDAEVLIEVHYSSVNYKDGLASLPKSTIVKQYPFIPGIDLAGVVVDSKDERYKVGDEVIATSYEIGVTHYGGYSQYARIPSKWIVPLPEELSLKEAMFFGTAGFTAALSINRLENSGIMPDKGKVLVTGATGGVGSTAVAMLHKLGYQVVASTGKQSAEQFLKEIGASEVISREDVYEEKVKPLDKQLWSAAIDPVGGQMLASVLSKISYGGSVAVSGLTGGTSVPTAVFPFILRGVNLLGIDSVYCPMEERQAVWNRIAGDMKPNGFMEKMATEIKLDELPIALKTIFEGRAQGRMIVNLINS
ncbi:NADPH:quinone oxidoreductase family protein [Aquibacillus kalidii]|uniref:NADPH:quinone oxidoreductase family protein n=1 Tax=Aquibacillus kalidii TaxID=2762597 RepID=UPI0016469664|nr:acryloyl-CoA reductase [Aquibacillus kalidii]